MTRTTTSKSPPAPVYILGVGLTKFTKPHPTTSYSELGFEAVTKALLDAHLNYDCVEQAIACYCYGDSTCGQRVFYQFGLTQIPIYNVNNNAATGATGLHLARTIVGHGGADCVLVLGLEKMYTGPLRSFWADRENPVGRVWDLLVRMGRGGEEEGAPGAVRMFGEAGREYMARYGAVAEDFAEIARINHAHSQHNPYSQFHDVYSLDDILKSPMVYPPLTKLQCCPNSDGAAAAVLVSQAFLDARPELKDQAILIAGQCLATDAPSVYDGSAINLMGYDMTRKAARTALAEAGVQPNDIKVCELHDCFSTNEMITIDALGLSDGPGKAIDMVRKGLITYGDDAGDANRRCVVNPSGGLISKGHPLGATGIAQCAELTWQLRGWATNRLVPDAGVALQHILGLGGAAVVTVYKRADGKVKNEWVDSETVAKKTGLGYNPAVEARGFTMAQVDSVRSRKCRSEWALADVQRKVMAKF
ncbi:MAG: hypothetical protein M1816_007981 [Peltula sp. TS41687]|nr:MAG: hypothetical protein M1816_007981 [Peltula sp. TS41687]